MYVVDVARMQRLGPSFLRLTFTGDDLGEFGVAGHDQRVKLMLPQHGRSVADIPRGASWYASWRALPSSIRPIMRTYTVRAFRPTAAEVDIDIVLHGEGEADAGAVSAWAATAQPGDRVALLAPDRPGAGRMWGCEWAPQPSASRLLLAGDETAVPAIGAIIESLPPDRCGLVCVEVPRVGDVQQWSPPHGIELRWLVRHDESQHAHGALLEATVSDVLDSWCGARPRAVPLDLPDVDIDGTTLWDVPGDVDPAAGELYAWLAGEAGVIKRLRRRLVDDYQVPRSAVAFMGYWRQGRRELT